MPSLSRWLLPLLGAALWSGQAAPAAAAAGTVIWKHQGCAHFILQTQAGYGLYEWVSGALPNDGDVMEGRLDVPSWVQLHNLTADLPVTVFVVAHAPQRAVLQKSIPARCR